jgi:CHAD domain-containing protein
MADGRKPRHAAAPRQSRRRGDVPVPGNSVASPVSVLAVKAGKVALDRKMSARVAFASLARAGLIHLTANERAVLSAAEPEGIHQMRVAIRRLRALLAVFAPHLDADATAFLRRELKWLQRKLGPARDWDVFLFQTLAPLMQRLQHEPGLAAMSDAAFEARRRAYLVVDETFRDRRYARFVMRFQLWLDSVALEERKAAALPAGKVAAKVLRRRYRKVMKRGRRRDLADREMHKLRIQVKKLTAAVRFFRPLYRGKRLRRFVKTLVLLQDRLGSLQDAVVGRDLAAGMEASALLPPHNGSPPSSTVSWPLERAAAMVVGFETARIVDDRRRFKEAWPQFAQLKTFWRKTA